MDETSEWLKRIKGHATLLYEAYRLELGRLWWANLMFVVVPAVLSTAAAIVAALKPPAGFSLGGGIDLPLASAFAGAAAVLIAVHKALKCDEYQAECVRLGQAYESIAIAAGSALARPNATERDTEQKRISEKMEVLAESAKARIPTRIIRKAQKRVGKKTV